MQEKIKQFHFRGGIDYSQLNFIHTMMMNMLKKMLLKNATNAKSSREKNILAKTLKSEYIYSGGRYYVL